MKEEIENKLDACVQAYQRTSIYDFDNTIQLRWYPERIATLTAGNHSLLELGLGHGITANAFEKHFPRHVVVDASAAVIDNFRNLYPTSQVHIVQSYFETFDTPERFDVIVFGYILEHVNDPVYVLSHFKKFLKPGGKVFVTVPNAEVLNRRLGHLAGMLPDIQQLSEHDLLLGHQRYYTVASLIDDITSAGFSVSKIEGIYLKPLATHQMIAMNFDEHIIDAFCQIGINYPELSCGILAELKIQPQ